MAVERSGPLRRALARHETLAAGIVTGGLAGLAMMALAMIGAVIEDLTPAHPALVMGETLVGPEALGGAAKAAYGAFVHLVISAAIGILFAGLVPRDFPTASAIGVGVGFTLLLFMFIMMPLAVPWLNPGFRGGMQGIGGTWVAALGLFGVVLGTAPALRRWAAREARGGTPTGARSAAPAGAGPTPAARAP